MSGDGEDWRRRVEAVLGPATDARPLGDGVWALSTRSGPVVVKRGPGASDEAEGLARLASWPGAPPVPDVVVAEPGLVALRWVDQGPRTAGHDEFLGRSLAGLHDAPWPEWGGGSSWIGSCRADPAVHADGPSFLTARLGQLAERCGLGPQTDRLSARIGSLLPPDGPSLLHGDLWWGTVLWGADGRAWLIDPSVHGGYPEEDLAMLALFGTVPDAVVRSYVEVRPLAEGWEDRVGLFQLVPLLVHTILFGGAYRARAEEVLHRLS